VVDFSRDSSVTPHFDRPAACSLGAAACLFYSVVGPRLQRPDQVQWFHGLHPGDKPGASAAGVGDQRRQSQRFDHPQHEHRPGLRVRSSAQWVNLRVRVELNRLQRRPRGDPAGQSRFPRSGVIYTSPDSTSTPINGGSRSSMRASPGCTWCKGTGAATSPST